MVILATICRAIKPSGNPLIDIAGAYFPAWLAAILGGLLLAVVARWVLGRLSWAAVLEPEVVMFPVLFAVGSCAVWLVFFSAG